MLGILLFELRQRIGALLFYMASLEIHYRLGVLGAIRWRLLRGGEISVRWPSGIINGSAVYSGDPNDHYRPWLEANVGRQGRDWDWRIGAVGDGGYSAGDRLAIRVRKSKSHTLSAMALMWG